MQANGAEMLRLACCLLTEHGITVCAPVHDAVLIEGPAEAMDEVVATSRELLGEASRVVLDGFEITTDVEVFSHPQRYVDVRGVAMWHNVTQALREVEPFSHAG